MMIEPEKAAMTTTPNPPLKIPVHDAQALTKGGALAEIALNEQIYTLRITRTGKLILTK